ncbi:hypothetical protein BpHYR1_051168 [Brachionus plicatilis]|uniref:Uncharacterized protein n=1 Tax=Brachionus plicatilis TaxID=10195 RepID=A0A3M7RHP9_BRAPC|nr:hypothetical protein BpHYR1_051168 [Brachionus plicatilis]
MTMDYQSEWMKRGGIGPVKLIIVKIDAQPVWPLYLCHNQLFKITSTHRSSGNHWCSTNIGPKNIALAWMNNNSSWRITKCHNQTLLGLNIVAAGCSNAGVKDFIFASLTSEKKIKLSLWSKSMPIARPTPVMDRQGDEPNRFPTGKLRLRTSSSMAKITYSWGILHSRPSGSPTPHQHVTLLDPGLLKQNWSQGLLAHGDGTCG